MKEISLQWLTSDPGLVELDWLQELMPQDFLSRLQVHTDPDQVELAKYVLLITNSVCSYRHVLERFRNRGSRYGILLLSDEYLHDPCEWLADPNCIFLIRNYVNPNLINNPKVLTFGLGYTRGFAGKPELFMPFEYRSLAWSFAGTPHGDRAMAVRLFSQFQPYQVHSCSGFLSSDGLAIHEYAALLGKSLFSLCPPGYSSNDTYRLYESLEAGCIPIVLANSDQFRCQPSYWHAIFSGMKTLPFVIGCDYAECFDQVKSLVAQGELAQRQQECRQFWDSWKRRWNHQLNMLIKKLGDA